MLYIHPLLQLAATTLGFYALLLAWPRFVSLHLGHGRAFQRPRHVLVGKLAWGIMLAGLGVGLLAARLTWGGWLLSGAHAWVGLTMLPLLLWGLASGLFLAARPKKRLVLPLLHGLANLALLALALVQLLSGRQML